MSEIDKIKEEIGWLKILFGVLVAVDVSLIGWIAQNFAKASFTIQLLTVIAAAVITCATIAINRRAYGEINKLGEL